MAQTDLNADDFCGYNVSAAPFYWTFEPNQYENTFAVGEVGINAAGGTGGSYVRPDVIDVSSFLSGRDDVLSRCQPPIPPMDDWTKEELKKQDEKVTINLLPEYTREKKSAVDLSAINYNRWNPILTNPQDLGFVIENMWAQRGGLDTTNYLKSSWVQQNEVYSPGSCGVVADPQRSCGSQCDSVSGYPGQKWISNTNINLNTNDEALWSGQSHYADHPVDQPEYPFPGPYSQDIESVGASACGPNYFTGGVTSDGTSYNDGSCPVQKSGVLQTSLVGSNPFDLEASRNTYGNKFSGLGQARVPLTLGN